jgi:hypothetical protein
MIREPIYAALFALWGDIPGLVTVSRRLKHWSDVPANEHPALFQVQRKEKPVQDKGVPTKWFLHVDLYLYVNSGDPDVPPSPLLNAILDAIEAKVPAPGTIDEVQALGGLVSHAWISGEIETDEGTLGSQAVAIIPIEILAA